MSETRDVTPKVESYIPVGEYRRFRHDNGMLLRAKVTKQKYSEVDGVWTLLEINVEGSLYNNGNWWV